METKSFLETFMAVQSTDLVNVTVYFFIEFILFCANVSEAVWLLSVCDIT